MNMLCSPKPCSPLIECIRVAISILHSDFVREDGLCDRGVSLTVGKELDMPQVGKKRSVQDSYYIQLKRQRTIDIGAIPSANEHIAAKITEFSPDEQDKQCAGILHSQLATFITLLKPENIEASTLRPEIAIAALSLLCIAFHGFPDTSLSISIFQQVLSWMPWICNQV